MTWHEAATAGWIRFRLEWSSLEFLNKGVRRRDCGVGGPPAFSQLSGARATSVDASPRTEHLVPEFPYGVIEPATAAIPTLHGDGRDSYPLQELLLGTVNILISSQRSKPFPSEGRATPHPSPLRPSVVASERRHPATMRRGFWGGEHSPSGRPEPL